SQVPSTVPTAPKSVSTAIRRATAAKSPSRNSCRASMTMFGMIRTATALLTSITSASSGVARGGKPKLMAPLTRAARSTAAALKRAAGMRHPTLTPFFDVAHHPEGFDHDAGVRPRRRHSDAHAGSLGVGLRRRRGRRVSDVRLRPGGDGQAREGRYLAHARRLPVLHAPSLRPRRRLPLLPALSLGPEHRQGESAPVYGPTLTETITERLLGENGAFVHDWKAPVNAPLSQRVHVNRGGTLPRRPPVVLAQDIGPGLVHQGREWRVTAAPAEHVQPFLDSLAYRLEGPDGSIVFTGDTQPCASVVNLARGADMMVCICWDDQERMGAMGEAGGQCGTTGAARMAEEAGVR